MAPHQPRPPAFGRAHQPPLLLPPLALPCGHGVCEAKGPRAAAPRGRPGRGGKAGARGGGGGAGPAPREDAVPHVQPRRACGKGRQGEVTISRASPPGLAGRAGRQPAWWWRGGGEWGGEGSRRACGALGGHGEGRAEGRARPLPGEVQRLRLPPVTAQQRGAHGGRPPVPLGPARLDSPRVERPRPVTPAARPHRSRCRPPLWRRRAGRDAAARAS